MNATASCQIAFREVLVPIDISTVSANALAYSKAIAKRYDSHIMLVHVWPPPRHLAIPEGGWADVLVSQPGEAEMEALGSELRSEGYTAEMINAYGSVKREVMSLASAHDADLVVLGVHEKRGLRRLIFGSQAESIIRDSNCPVLAVGPAALPPHNNAWSPRHIICIASPGTASAKAAAFGYCLAHESSARFELYYAEDPGIPPDPSDWREFEEAFNNELPGGEARHCLVQDYFSQENPAQSIIEAAKDHDADLIVLGARHALPGSTHFRRGILPDVLLHSQCPVLTINSHVILNPKTKQFIN